MVFFLKAMIIAEVVIINAGRRLSVVRRHLFLICFLYHKFADELGEACRVVQGDSCDELGLAV